jgi:hypothetical protein
MRKKNMKYDNERLKPIKEVYEKYKHLDKCLSDTSLSEEFESQLRYDLWQAIRLAMQDNLS